MAAGQPYMVSAARTRRFTITIPGVGAAATIESLVAAVATPADLPDLMRVLGCKISGLVTAGTARAAFTVGDTAAAQTQFVAAGSDYLEPAMNDYRSAFIASASTAIVAVVILYVG
jgi:post-segregation antitoxin (ccd killing protein)